MDYGAQYEKIIKRAVDRSSSNEATTLYMERHHITPKCMGGSNRIENLVYLTAREHFVAHRLLARLYSGVHGLVYAAYMMSSNGRTKNVKCSRAYAFERDRFSAERSSFARLTYQPMRDQSVIDKRLGEGNPNSRLTAEAVYEIRRLGKEGVSNKEIAKQLGLYPQLVYAVIKRITWKHLHE